MNNAVIKQEETELPATQSAGDVMSMMIKAAKHMDTDKLSKLMDLQERILNRNAKSEFAADYVRMKPHLPKVLRTKDNTQTKSKYAPLEEINQAVDPVLEQYGFGTATKVTAQTADSVTVQAELWHRGGHIEETTITMPLDKAGIQGTVNKTGPHATASSVTYAKRVAICALLNISTGDDVDGNQITAFVDTEKAVEIDLLIAEVKADKEKFLKFMGVDDVRHIRANEYSKAIKSLKVKKQTGAPK
jgi:hypothetical protein